MKEEIEEKTFYRIEIKMEDGGTGIVIPKNDKDKKVYWFKLKKDAVNALKRLKKEEFPTNKLRVVKILETSFISEWI